jgi:hypothetical protein
LQREQGLVGQRSHLAALADARLDVGDVAGLAGAVDDHEQRVVALVEEHQVVDDAALVVQQQPVALLAHGQVDHVHGHQRLERCGGIGADQVELAHVRHVEQARRRARVVVLGHQAGGVLHGHGIAREGHHAGAQLDVQGVEGGGEQIGHGSGEGKWWSDLSIADLPRCPLYLRDSPRLHGMSRGLLLRWAACCAAASLQQGERPHPCGRVASPFA